MKTRKCAVCNKEKAVSEFGDGCRVPKTTCLACKTKIAEFVEVKMILCIKRIIRGEIK